MQKNQPFACGAPPNHIEKAKLSMKGRQVPSANYLDFLITKRKVYGEIEGSILSTYNVIDTKGLDKSLKKCCKDEIGGDFAFPGLGASSDFAISVLRKLVYEDSQLAKMSCRCVAVAVAAATAVKRNLHDISPVEWRVYNRIVINVRTCRCLDAVASHFCKLSISHSHSYVEYKNIIPLLIVGNSVEYEKSYLHLGLRMTKLFT